MPPVFIVGAGNDKLLRSSKIYAEHLQKGKRDVAFKVYEGTDHGFFSFGKGSDELHTDILNFLSKQN
ncbi:MAG: alpha/beta hydrolase fold domain-containing protein [Saprospiraceae bacterium]